ncbi:MAG: type II toxin-antitoxin system HigB family toxin [Elusimicrobia bacterium]|nr:type II toxin-antitoxin system HigB family toxin [Elusimicrobiota bacterium]
MTLTGADRVDAYRTRHPEASAGLDRWRRVVKQTVFRSTLDLKRTFAKSYDYVPPHCHVFDIAHGRHRLIAQIDFPTQIVSVEELLDHKRYDRWKCL